ncbi:MAG: ABC transporter permease [Bdellovibrionales bacterium]|nr:ABC transporter permease [Bdellovibrionales bacterium]
MLGAAKLSIQFQFEYRINFFSDVFLSPVTSAAIEVTLWWSIFKSTGNSSLNGFSPESYLAYALWAAFFARISISWMYDFLMIDEIDSGRVNAILTRPISFYEFYLGQFMGYKFLCTLFSFVVPIGVCSLIHFQVSLLRLPLALALVFYYLILVYTMGFTLAALAFFYNRVHAIPMAKNIVIWVLSGELFPLDLIPDPYKYYLLNLPFASGVYIPVGYLTGRVDSSLVLRGFTSTTVALIFFGTLGHLVWKKGTQQYSGTGA